MKTRTTHFCKILKIKRHYHISFAFIASDAVNYKNLSTKNIYVITHAENENKEKKK